MSMILDGSNGVTFNDASLQGAAASPYVLKNRIINGAMEIDQRNAGASVTSSAGNNIYSVDRWFGASTSPAIYTMQQSTDAPAGFVNSVVVTVTTPDTSLAAGDFNAFKHIIEGLNVADFGWGTANAQSITLSFWVKSSLTGTFTCAFRNSAVNRSYIETYTINTANTWEKKSVTIAGDTSGTWLTTNGIGIRLDFSLGSGSNFQGTADAWTATNDITTSGATSVVGTNGATFYITGVQLEQNTTATPFERRLISQELANCYRYYWQDPAAGIDAYGTAGMNVVKQIYFPVTMRISPSTITQPGAIITSSNTANTTFTFDTGTSGINQVNAIISASTAARTYLYRLVQFSSEL
jgi:hypothetical protein